MKIRRRSKLMIEPPTHATGDIVFNLIIFFLITISIQPDTGRPQDIPRNDPEETQQTKPIEVILTPQAVILDGDPIGFDMFQPRLIELINRRESEMGNATDDFKIVTLLTKDKSTPFDTWVSVTTKIHDAGGVVTLQMEEERTIIVE